MDKLLKAIFHIQVVIFRNKKIKEVHWHVCTYIFKKFMKLST